MLRALLSFVVLTMLCLQPACGQRKEAPDSEKALLSAGEVFRSSIDSAINPFIDSNEIAGAVVLVADKEGVLAIRSLGLADIAAQKPMSKSNIFWIASMTKPVTAACIMMLQDEGKLSLDDPITKHLPSLKSLKLPDGMPANITVRQLLSHTSGMAELKAEEAYTSLDLTRQHHVIRV